MGALINAAGLLTGAGNNDGGIIGAVIGTVGSLFQSKGRKRQLALQNADAQLNGYASYKEWKDAGKPWKGTEQEFQSILNWTDGSIEKAIAQFKQEGRLHLVPEKYKQYIGIAPGATPPSVVAIPKFQSNESLMAYLQNTGVKNGLGEVVAKKPFDIGDYIKLPEVGIDSSTKKMIWAVVAVFAVVFLVPKLFRR